MEEIQPPKLLQVHGSVRQIELEDPDVTIAGAIVRMDLDSCQDRKETPVPISPLQVVQFFYPNYKPRNLQVVDRVWVELELISGWQEASFLTSKRKWIKLLTDAPGKYDYSIAGELFFYKSGTYLLPYLDVGFPILAPGLSSSTEAPDFSVKEGQFIQFTRGSLYGEVGPSNTGVLSSSPE